MDEDEAWHRFTAMYDAHRNQVWGYAACVGGRQRADDVVSETFVVAWRRFADVPDPALPWLLGVARNMARDGTRAEVRRGWLESELRHWASGAVAGGPGQFSAVVAGPEDSVATRLDVLRALAVLPERDREVLILTAWQELTPHEAAQVLGTTPAAIRVRLHRARRRLRRALDTAKPRPAHRETEMTASARRRLEKEHVR